MGDGRGGREYQAGDHGKDGGEGDGAQEGEEEVADDRGDVGTHLLSQHQGRHVATRVYRGDALRGEVDSGTEAEQRGQDVEAADDEHRDDDGFACCLCGRHGEEAHEDVRHAGGAEHECHTEGDLVKRVLQVKAGLEEALACVHAGEDDTVFEHQLGYVVLDLRASHDGGEEADRVEAGLDHDQDGEQEGAGHEEARLDDLNPGGGDHAAEDDVPDHQDTDADDGQLVGDADQKGHQFPRTDHLGGEVEGGDGDRGDGGEGAHRLGRSPEGEDVTKGVLARVTAGLRDDQEHGDVGNQPADRVHEAVIAVQRDEAGNTEEGGCRHVVAGDGPAVLGSRDATPRSVEVRCGLGLLGGPDDDPHGDGDDHEEHPDGDGPVSFKFFLCRCRCGGGRCGH